MYVKCICHVFGGWGCIWVCLAFVMLLKCMLIPHLLLVLGVCLNLKEGNLNYFDSNQLYLVEMFVPYPISPKHKVVKKLYL